MCGVRSLGKRMKTKKTTFIVKLYIMFKEWDMVVIKPGKDIDQYGNEREPGIRYTINEISYESHPDWLASIVSIDEDWNITRSEILVSSLELMDINSRNNNII